MSTHNPHQEFRIKPYSTLELSRIYGISYSTMKRWLKRIKERIGKKVGHYFSVKQIEVIVDEFGCPKTINLD